MPRNPTELPTAIFPAMLRKGCGEMAMDNSSTWNKWRGKRTSDALLLFIKGGPFYEQKNRTIHVLQNRTFLFTLDTPARGTKVTARQEAIDEAKKNYGYFVLLSNEIKDPLAALEIYRNKDLVEKAFGNLKERLNFSRTSVSSDQSLDGKLFVEFIALIYLSYLKKKMQDKELFKKYTMQELLDEFDIIECFEQPGHEMRVGEVTKKQIELYEAMDIVPPTSLH
jgi:hypothetical protein